jgi:hypothetical protein
LSPVPIHISAANFASEAAAKTVAIIQSPASRMKFIRTNDWLEAIKSRGFFRRLRDGLNNEQYRPLNLCMAKILASTNGI